MSKEGACSPNPSYVGVGGSFAEECAKMGMVEQSCFCLCTKEAEGNELARGLEICMRGPRLKKQILPTVYNTIDILDGGSRPLSPSFT